MDAGESELRAARILLNAEIARAFVTCLDELQRNAVKRKKKKSKHT